MLKRLCSLFLILALLFTLLPAQADIAPLTAQEIATVRAFIAMEGEGSSWQRGMAVTPQMNALQVQQYLEWLLSDEIGGLMNQVLDSAELLNLGQAGKGASLEGVGLTLQQLRNRIASYHDTLEQGRRSVYNNLLQLNSNANMSAQGKLRIAIRVRDDMAEMQRVIDVVAKYYEQYHQLLEQSTISFSSLLQAADSPDNEITGAALGKLNSEAKARLNAELKQLSAQNDVSFDVVVLSSKQFGFIVRDGKGNPLKNVKVHAACSGTPTLNQDAWTSEDGLVTFLTKDFDPDEDNRVVINVVLTKDYYCTREMRNLTIRGGSAEPVALELYTGQPFLRMAGFNGRDILSQKSTIFYSPKNDSPHYFDILLDNLSKTKVSGWMYLCYKVYDDNGELVEKEEKRSFTSGTAVSFLGRYCQQIAPGSTVSVRVETPSFTRTYQTQLQIEKAVVDEPQFINTKALSFTGPTLGLTFPEEIPFFGGSNLSLGVPQVPAQLAIDPSGYIQFAYGHDFRSELLDWKSEGQKQVEERMDRAARRTQRDVNAVDNQVYQNAGAKDNIKFIGNTSAAITVFAGMQGRVKSDASRISLSGSGGIQAAFKGGFGWQAFIAGFIPAFFAMDMTFAIGATFGLGLEADLPDLSNPKFQFNNGLGLTIEMLAELGVSLGLGVRGMASIAMRFFGKVVPRFTLGTPVSASVALGFGLEVVAQLFILKWKQTLWKGSYVLDTNANGASLQGTMPTMAQSATVYAAVNTPASANSVLSAKNGGGLPTDKEEVVFSRVDSMSQEIQYVTLTSSGGDRSATFGFWITPSTVSASRQAELVWYNLDHPANHGVVYANGSGDTYRQSQSTDYAFAIMGHKNVVAVNVLSGKFANSSSLTPDTSRSTLAVLETIVLADGTLSLALFRNVVSLTQTDVAYYYPQDLVTGGPQGFTLSMPLIHLTHYNDGGWFANAAYNLEFVSNGHTSHVVSTDVQFLNGQLSKSFYVSYNPDATDSAGNPTSITRKLAIARPGAVTVDGTPRTPESLSCYYRLNVSREASEIADEGTTLTLHMNGTKRFLDTDVMFFSPLVEYGAIPDQADYLFYLKNGQADDGSECFRLMGMQSKGYKNYIIRDYDVPMYAESFKIVTVDDGSEYGITYLYWTECVSPSEYNASESYQVKCVRFDRASNTMSAPFTLVELSQMPSSLYILMDGSGFYTAALPDKDAQQVPVDSAAVSQQLVHFTFSLQTAVSLNGVASYDPCVCAGEYASLLFAVKNTGNLPVSRFMVAIVESGSSNPVQTIMVDCRDPQTNSVNSLFTTVADSAYSVNRVDSLYDDINGDNWLITTRTLPTQSTQTAFYANANDTVTQVHTNLLMPGDVHTYRASFKVPDDWTGKVQLTAILGQVVALTHYTASLYGTPVNSLDVEYAFDENGELLYSNQNAPSAIGVKRAQVSAAEFSKDIGLGAGDLMLDCQPYTDLNGTEYVRVNIVGRSETASTAAPTLTASLNGTTVFTYHFANAIDEDFGYTLDIPAFRLLMGQSSGEVLFTVTDNETDENTVEFSDFDNKRTVVLGASLGLALQPSSITVKEGENAVFSVAATGGVQPYAYQWQRFINGRWVDIDGAASATLVIPAVSKKDYGARVRCAVRDSLGGHVVSDEAKLTVQATVPVTGDTAQPALWAALLIAAILLLFLLRHRGKQQD